MVLKASYKESSQKLEKTLRKFEASLPFIFNVD